MDCKERFQDTILRQDTTLRQDTIQHPAATPMLTRLATVVQDVGVVAPGVFQGICENGKGVKLSLI